MNKIILAEGLVYIPGYWTTNQQSQVKLQIDQILQQAPLFQPCMPRTGKPFSVQMSNCGLLGWVSDINGYRYQSNHPLTYQPWPVIPDLLQKAWTELSGFPVEPEACLINIYTSKARMGLHQDRDEKNFEAPVVSLSLGVSAVFRYGGLKRNDPTQSIKLHSGDALIMGGASRLVFHGIDRILPATSNLLNNTRINMTLRKVY